MSIFMIDSAFAPTLANAQAAKAAGIKLWAGYVAGGRVYHAWSRQDFDVIRQAGMRPVFVHVGTSGQEAVANAWQCGAMTGDIVALDVEAGWNDTYSQAWCAAVKAAGFTAWLYGLDSEVNAHGAPFDGVWAARYVYPTVPTPTSRESIQYWNSHDEFGVGVDRSVCDDRWATQGDKLDLDTARSIVHITLATQGILGDQAQVDSFAVPMSTPGTNPEGVLANLEADINADPRTAVKRLAAVEAKVAATPASPDLTAVLARLTALENHLADVVTILKGVN